MDEDKRRGIVKWMAAIFLPAVWVAATGLMRWHFSTLQILEILAVFTFAYGLIVISIFPAKKKKDDLVMTRLHGRVNPSDFISEPKPTGGAMAPAVVPKNEREARELAERHLVEMQGPSPHKLVIVDSTETEFGWIFYWSSKEYGETGDVVHALLGNTPLIVDRRDGLLRHASTSLLPDEIIECYRRAGAANR